MPFKHEAQERTDRARADFHQTVMAAFCQALRSTDLPPMKVLELAAMAIGSVYQEVAEAHRGDNPCPCGWKPDTSADIETLQAALAAMVPALQPSSLMTMPTLGRA